MMKKNKKEKEEVEEEPSFFEFIKQNIADKILGVLGLVIEKTVNFSFENVKQKIIEIEEMIVKFIKTVVILSILKAFFIIMGFLFLALSLIKVLNYFFSPEITYLILGTFFIILGILTNPKPIKDF